MRKKEIDLDSKIINDKLNNIVEHMEDLNNYCSFEEFSDQKVDDYLYDLPDHIFYKYCYVMLTSQSYGSKFQEKFMKTYTKYYLKKVKSKEERGDFANHKNFEFKMPFLTKNKPIANIVQIRLSHTKIDYYIIQIIDARISKDDYKLYATLCLTKYQMENEVKLTGNNSAHGKEGKAGFRIDLTFGAENFNRFIKNYQFDEKIMLDIDNKL